jgi:hypothetical protein
VSSSVSLSASLLAAGCLDAPPEYSVPEQIPPIILAGQVDPSPGRVHEIRAGQEDEKFNVPFRSRDLGEELSAYLFRFDPPRGPDQLVRTQINIPPDDRPLSEQAERSVALTWTFPAPNELQGCQRLTLVLSHESNFGSTDDNDPVALDPDRAARVTWWFNFSPESTLFSDCVVQQEAP